MSVESSATGGTCFTTITAEAEGTEAGETWHQGRLNRAEENPCTHEPSRCALPQDQGPHHPGMQWEGVTGPPPLTEELRTGHGLGGVSFL